MTINTKAIVSVAEMARMIGLSRARFYQLIGTAFPHPVYSVSTRRPFYDEEMQEKCLEVRRRNCGIDGHPILFYSRRPPIAAAQRKKTAPTKNEHADLIESLKALGLVVTPAQVAQAIKEEFPGGTIEIDQSGILRSVFIRLRSGGK